MKIEGNQGNLFTFLSRLADNSEFLSKFASEFAKRITLKTKILIAILLLFAPYTHAQKHEVRAVWLTTIGGIDWPHSYSAPAQKRELTQILDQLKRVNVNTVLVQTRVRGTTIYPSALEPWDGCLSGNPGRSPGYDALQLVVDECHRRGMECHAWVVTIPLGKWNKLGCVQMRKKYPALVRHIGEDGFMDPTLPETGDYLARFCSEITRNYDIDGIHLDYIRYPETWPKAGRKKGTKGSKLTVESSQTKRDNITSIVRKIHRAVKSEKPWVKLSCSPIGKSGDLSRYRSGGWNAYYAVYQDAQGWLRDGLMDQLYPMMYFRGNNFYPFALDWQERSYGRTIVSGLGVYFLSPSEGNWPLADITREMNFIRENGLGHAYFRSKFLTDDTKGIYRFVREFDQAPALIPPMTWAWNLPPTSPTRFVVNHGQDSDQLSWGGATDRSRASYLLYNIYASTTPDVDTSEPRNLIATRLTAAQVSIPHRKGQTLYYAVCAMDRYGNESTPATEGLKETQLHKLAIQRTDGRRLLLPEKGNTLDAEYLAIETLQGQVVMTIPYRGRQASISRLSDGIYVMRSIGRKGINHRLGYFSIKR